MRPKHTAGSEQWRVVRRSPGHTDETERDNVYKCLYTEREEEYGDCGWIWVSVVPSTGASDLEHDVPGRRQHTLRARYSKRQPNGYLFGVLVD